MLFIFVGGTHEGYVWAAYFLLKVTFILVKEACSSEPTPLHKLFSYVFRSTTVPNEHNLHPFWSVVSMQRQLRMLNIWRGYHSTKTLIKTRILGYHSIINWSLTMDC